jgi:hypothetical protein
MASFLGPLRLNYGRSCMRYCMHERMNERVRGVPLSAAGPRNRADGGAERGILLIATAIVFDRAVVIEHNRIDLK